MLNIVASLVWYEWALLGIFGFIYLLKIFYLFLFTARILYRENTIKTVDIPMSLILTYRNEEENLKKILPKILGSLNADSEVVAVDDYSQDNSLSVVGVLRKDHSNLIVSALNQEIRYSEKMAKNIALKAASKNWVLIIPPNLTETSPEWLSTISSKMTDEMEVIVNYTNLKSGKGFYHLIYRNECFFQQLKSVGFILNQLPYLNFEENIAFKKEKYFESGGFGRHINENFASLELVLNDFISKKKTAINFCTNTAIRKEMSISKTDYFELLEKELHIQRKLSFSKRFVLSLEKILTFLFYPFAVSAGLYFYKFWPVFTGLILLYIIAFSFIIKMSLNRLNERKLFLSSLGYALFMPIIKSVYQGYLHYRSRRKRKWRSKN